MAKVRIRRGNGVPSGLTFGELAYDATSKKLYVGVTSGSELLTSTDGGVSSFNGLTGAVSGVTTTTANTFTALQTFSQGITALGATLGTLRMRTIGGAEGGQIDFELAGATFTSLTGGVAIDVYNNQLRFFESGGTNRGAYIDLTAAATGVGTNLLSGGTPTAITITDTNAAATYYPIFAGGTGSTALFIDKATTPLTYSPSTSTLTSSAVSAANVSATSFLYTNSITEYVLTSGVNITTAGGSISLTDTVGGGAFYLDTWGLINIGDYSGSNNGNYLTYSDSASSLNFNSFSSITNANTVGLVNGEYLSNGTNGQMNIMPAPSGSTAFGIYFDMTSWSYGVIMGTIRSSDNAKNTGGNFRFDVPVTINADTRFQLGSDGHYGLYRTDTGNNTAQLFALSNNANNSGAFALVSYFDVGTANRSPATSHTHPNFYIYANGSTSANHFIRHEHDSLNANIVSGGTSGILIQPGSGTVGISGGISGGSYVIDSTGINALTGVTYTFLASDNGKVLTHSNSGGATLTVPSGLPVGFSATIIHLGTGSLGITSGAGVTLNSWTSKYRSVGQHATIGLISYSSNIFNLSGGLTG